MTPRLGWSMWLVRNPRSLATRQSYGRGQHWPGVRQHALEAGYPALAKAAKATVQRILHAQALQPHKIKYYLERRDPNFLPKMRMVLLVYQEVALQNEARQNGTAKNPLLITVSVDEKPGVQAIGHTAPDLPPVAGKYPTVARDHEYIRYGTWSILAGLDRSEEHTSELQSLRHLVCRLL